jgi:hypothetical protein
MLYACKKAVIAESLRGNGSVTTLITFGIA